MGFLEDQIAAAKAKEKEAKAKAAAKRRADITKARQLAKKMESDIAAHIAVKLREHDEGLYLHLRAQVESDLNASRGPVASTAEMAPVMVEPTPDGQNEPDAAMGQRLHDGGDHYEYRV